MRMLIAGLAMVSAAAASQPAPRPAGENAEIVVEGQKLGSRDIATAVRSISNPEMTGNSEPQYPRWADRICVEVVGFPRDGGQFVADRIGAVARDLKLDAGAPGCSPNIFIIATDDPTKLIARIRVKRQGLATGKDVAVVRRIQESHDAVRWIGAASMTAAGGAPTQPSAFGLSGKPATEFDSYDGGSRLVARTRTMLTRETIVVDTRQIGGVNYGQLSDYLAFVSLAQLNPHAAAPGVDSILSLFPRGGSAPPGLTRFDKAYLTGLYKSSADAVGAIQQSSIEQEIRRTSHPETGSASSQDTPSPRP